MITIAASESEIGKGNKISLTFTFHSFPYLPRAFHMPLCNTALTCSNLKCNPVSLFLSERLKSH